MTSKYSIDDDKNYREAKANLETIKQHLKERKAANKGIKAPEVLLYEAKKQLEGAKDLAVKRLKKRVRKEHEKAVVDLVNAFRQVAKAFERERGVRIDAYYSVGKTVCKAGYLLDCLDHGHDEEYGTNLYVFVEKLRKHGYPV